MASQKKPNTKPTINHLVAAAHQAGATVTMSLEPRVLYGCKAEQRDTYTLTINGGEEHRIEECGEVQIVFVNQKFKEAKFPMNGSYTRNGWRILAAIEQKISQIEQSYTKTKP